MMKKLITPTCLLPIIAFFLFVTSCGDDSDMEENPFGDYLEIRATECEKIGSVLQIDFIVINKSKKNLNVRVSPISVSDNKEKWYRLPGLTASFGFGTRASTVAHYLTEIEIPAGDTAELHIIAYDFDPADEATIANVSFSVGIYETDRTFVMKDSYEKTGLKIKDHRVKSHGVQTNDRYIEYEIQSCKKTDNDVLVLDFIMKNLTGKSLSNVRLEVSDIYDNLGNRYIWPAYQIKCLTGKSNIGWQSITDIPAGGTMNGTVRIDDFKDNASEITVYLFLDADNYIFSDNIARFITIPVK